MVVDTERRELAELIYSIQFVSQTHLYFVNYLIIYFIQRERDSERDRQRENHKANEAFYEKVKIIAGIQKAMN